MAENKKIKNATEVVFDNIKFRSIFEKDCYILLKQEGIKFMYEGKKIILLQGFYPSDQLQVFDLYKPKGSTKIFGNNTRKILDMTYTPDFYIQMDSVDIYIEAKGNPNDTYPLKKKLFLDYLRKESLETGKKYIFFEPHSKRQMREVIRIIKSYEGN